MLATDAFLTPGHALEQARLNIAIEVQRIFRPRKHGMDVVAHELLKRLPTGSDAIDYHVMVKDDTDKCLNSIPHRIIHTIKSAPYFIWEQFFLPRACREIKADILHCTANTAPLRSGVPLILTLHDVIFLEQSYLRSDASWYQRLGNTYRRMVVSYIVKKAVRIITVSNFQKELIMERLNVPAKKISVIYNGVDERFFETYSAEKIAGILLKFGLKRGYIFFMANTDPRKNTEGALGAYAKLRENDASAPRLVIKGISAEHLQHLLKKLKLEGLRPHIDIIGYIGYIDLPAIYKGASMFWFPSFSEGFGLPVAEAMACGTPVITSSTSCMPEIAGRAAMFIDPKDPSSLAFTARLILHNAGLAQRLSAAGKKRAAMFSWDKAINKTVAIYHEVQKMIKK